MDEAAREEDIVEGPPEVLFDEDGRLVDTSDISLVEPDWHDLAVDLRDDGVGQVEIARRCGVNQSSISRFFSRLDDEKDEPEHDIAVEYDLVRPHRMRTPRQILVDPQTKRSALEAFARGDITREELMKRITL